MVCDVKGGRTRSNGAVNQNGLRYHANNKVLRLFILSQIGHGRQSVMHRDYYGIRPTTLDCIGSNSDTAKGVRQPYPSTNMQRSVQLLLYRRVRSVLYPTLPHSPPGGIQRMPTDREEAQTGIEI